MSTRGRTAGHLIALAGMTSIASAGGEFSALGPGNLVSGRSFDGTAAIGTNAAEHFVRTSTSGVVGIGAVSTSDEAWRWSEGAGFIWTVETGMVSLNDALIAQGIDTQGFNFSLPLTISGDGLTIGGASATEDQPFGSNGFVVSLPSRSGPCPGEGSCCIPNGTPGCDDAGCCETICAQDPFCCDIEWDTVCVDQANGLCCDPPPCPGDGCCFAANESPGCDDAACCDAVCAADPFCCDTEWDGLCADGAIAVCFDP
ncbi:MAG: hypothetical protein ACYTF9_00225, partial [Planctomycetota bacterium]